MEPKFNLTINKPCSEKFNEFQKTSTGGFCNSCQKEVVDFRNMSDEQLIAYFKNRKEKTCGYFKDSQLKEYSYKLRPQSAPKFKYLRIAGLAIFSMISLNTIQAQDKKIKTEITDNPNKPNIEGIQSQTQERLLKGIVTSESEPLPGANIVLKNTNIGTSTNFDGEFEFPKPLKEGDVLVISFLGYKTQEIIIKNNQLALNAKIDFNIQMNEDMICVVGEVAVDEVYKSKRSLWQRIKGIF